MTRSLPISAPPEASRTFLRRFEFKLAVFSTSLFAIISIAMHFCAATRPEMARPHPGMWTEYLWYCGSMLTQVLYVALIWKTIRQRPHDLGQAIIASYPRIPLVLCPFISLWWLVHFLEGFILTLAIEGAIHRPGYQLAPTLWPIQALVIFVMVYASNVYLLLAVASITRNQGICNWVWRCRFLIDAFLTSAAVFATIM